jgi:hypothetical protein
MCCAPFEFLTINPFYHQFVFFCNRFVCQNKSPMGEDRGDGDNNAAGVIMAIPFGRPQ